MRHSFLATLCLGGMSLLSACAQPPEEASPEVEVERALRDVSDIEQSSLDDIMLSVADPAEAAAYFRKAAAEEPGRIDLQRSLADSLIRAGQPAEAAKAWTRVAAAPGATSEDRVALADALIRSGEWSRAGAELAALPADHGGFRRLKLEAMIADSNWDWSKADKLYRAATDATPTPAGVLNNWGFSKLTRGDYEGAERLFTEALTHDGTLFTAKNNLVLARGAQRDYDLPVVPMTQSERAQRLHTLALTAIKQGNIAIGQGLRDAVDTYPQHFAAAARALKALTAQAR